MYSVTLCGTLSALFSCWNFIHGPPTHTGVLETWTREGGESDYSPITLPYEMMFIWSVGGRRSKRVERMYKQLSFNDWWVFDSLECDDYETCCEGIPCKVALKEKRKREWVRTVHRNNHLSVKKRREDEHTVNERNVNICELESAQHMRVNVSVSESFICRKGDYC